MAKLVKLTSDGLNTNSNSFKAQSDDDIIIAPNSTVSLLNGHISSGILSNYKVGGDDRVAGEDGTILGSLFLTNPRGDLLNPPTDRGNREVLLRAGEYSANPMCIEMTRAFNKSLMYLSSCTTANAGTNTYITPPENDFGLETLVSLDSTKKVVIKYASTSQKYTADLTYSNKNSGVNIDPQGNITYTSPSGYAQIGLDKNLANNPAKQVYTTTDPTASFSQFDAVVLTNATVSATRQAIINDIQLYSTSTDTAIDLDPTKADVANQIVYSAANYTTTSGLPFNNGMLITTDDGTGVVGTPAANVNHGKFVRVDLAYNNENYEIKHVHPLKSFDNIQQYDFLQPPILNADGTYTLVIDSPFADATANHLIVGSIYYITNNADIIEAVCEATAIAENHGTNPTTVSMTVNAKPYNGKSIDIANMNFLNTIEAFEIEKNGITKTPIDAGQSVALFDKDANMLLTFELKTITDTGASFTIEAEEGSMVRISADGTTLLTGMDAMEQILQIVFDPVFAKTEAMLTCVDRIESEAPLDPTTITTIGDGDDIAVADKGGLINVDAVMTAAPQLFEDDNNDDYTIFPIDPNLPTTLETYQFRKQLFETLMRGADCSIFKTDNTSRLKITLMNNDAVANLATATRIWTGTDVVDTFVISLGGFRASQKSDLTQFTLMIKGTTVKPPAGAYCVEDNRLSHSCGRLAFLVSTALPCEFGVMPETSDFNSQNLDNAAYRIAIELDSGNYYYRLYKGSTQIALNTSVIAQDGDRVAIAWGVSPAADDFEYVEGGAVNSSSGVPSIATLIANTAFASGTIVEEDNGKILFSVLRTGRKENQIYLGCPVRDPNTGNDQSRAGKTIPWTPRSNPYLPPQYWDNTANLHAYVCPNQASIRVLELSPSPTITLNDGVWTEITGDQVLQDTSTHSTNPDNVDDPHRLKTFANVFNFQFTDIELQRRLGFKSSTNVLNGVKGSWAADLPYISALLPENLCILLDTLPSVETYDLSKTNGRRRSIIGVVVNSQDRAGEIVIEPNNLYRIKLNNDKPINLRRFVVSLEDFYGNEIVLQSARAVINLLFEDPTA